MKTEKNEKDYGRKMLHSAWIICAVLIAFYISIVLAFLCIVENPMLQIFGIVLVTVLMLIASYHILKIEISVGQYMCVKCGSINDPELKDAILAQHVGSTRRLRCHKCGKKTWNKKIFK